MINVVFFRVNYTWRLSLAWLCVSLQVGKNHAETYISQVYLYSRTISSLEPFNKTECLLDFFLWKLLVFFVFFNIDC